MGAAALSLAITGGVIAVLFLELVRFFKHVSLVEFFTHTRWDPLLEPQAFGVAPLLCGTLVIVVGALSIAMPLGLCVATSLYEFLPHRASAIIKSVLEILSGVPTVVYGLFALSFISPLVQKVFPQTSIFNALSACIVVGIMLLPMVIVLCDDALRMNSAPNRHAAYALGATPFEVVTGVLWPQILPQLLSISLLAASRALGETMIVSMVAGNLPQLSLNPLNSLQTMTSFIVQVLLGDAPQGTIAYMSAFAVGALLFFITFIFNALGALIQNAHYKKH